MKSSTKWKALAFFAVIFAALIWFTTQTDESPVTTAKANPPAQAAADTQAPEAPAFTLQDIEGNNVSLADYKGKVVFVNFWATWCPPCRAEIPHFVELIDKYGEDGFVILGISIDNPKDFEKVPGFADKFNINYPVLYGNRDIASLYGGIPSIPTTFVIDREGKALGKIVGARSYDQFEDIIKQVL